MEQFNCLEAVEASVDLDRLGNAKHIKDVDKGLHVEGLVVYDHNAGVQLIWSELHEGLLLDLISILLQSIWFGWVNVNRVFIELEILDSGVLDCRCELALLIPLVDIVIFLIDV